MADQLHLFGLALCADLINELLALFTIRRIDPHLDQLVVGQRVVDFAQHVFAEPVLPDNDHRLEVMGALAQEFFLAAGQGHENENPDDEDLKLYQFISLLTTANC